MGPPGVELDHVGYTAPTRLDALSSEFLPIPPSRDADGHPLASPYTPEDLQACAGGHVVTLLDIPEATQMVILGLFPGRRSFSEISIDELREFLASDVGQSTLACISGSSEIRQVLYAYIREVCSAAAAARSAMPSEVEDAAPVAQLIRGRLHGTRTGNGEEDEFDVW